MGGVVESNVVQKYIDFIVGWCWFGLTRPTPLVDPGGLQDPVRCEGPGGACMWGAGYCGALGPVARCPRLLSSLTRLLTETRGAVEEQILGY